MAFKKPTAPSTIAESPDRLFMDLPRRKYPSLYDHQGQILRNYVSTALKAPDVALQLPTGSGKTLVGLLLAEWRRRKFRERVVYLCPTRQLVNQVVNEASAKYGLSVESFIGSAKNYDPSAKAAYENGDRVAITTYSSVFNTNPFFSTPEIIIVDDAHAAENYIASHWTVRISRADTADEQLFKAVAAVLKPTLSETNYRRLTGQWQSADDAAWVDKVPTPLLRKLSDELHAAISTNVHNKEQRFAWSMIEDHLLACQLYVSSSEILIRPLVPPTWSHKPFEQAKQRIFMSATLGSGGDLERLTGRHRIHRLAIPAGWDRQGIGRRFFIFPEKSLKEKEVQDLKQTLMRRAGRSLVLTPSNESAEAITKVVEEKLKFPVFSGADLEDRKADFVKSSPAVAVVANRFDGIDFPDDDCRLLFIEGLPRAGNLQERFLMNRMAANLLFNERIQTRVLQAVGRCTRGLNDYSAVIVTGEDLPGYLTDRKRRSYLHPELQAELDFGIDQSTSVDIATLLENFAIFMAHDAEWEEANETILESRGQAVQAEFPAMSDLSNAVAHEIAWQKAMWDGDYTAAYDAAREVLGNLNDPGLRGYRALWHYLAGSAARLGFEDGDASLAESARKQFHSAKGASSGIPWLSALARLDGQAATKEEQADVTTTLQVERLEAYLGRLGTVHNRAFSAREKEIREGLANGASFEAAQVLLGEHLGFEAGKREVDASPDPWWRIGDVVFVFEDHANANESSILDATKARQAASHPDWIKSQVAGTSNSTIISVLVTPVRRAKSGAMPHLQRVAHWSLNDFRAWAETALTAIREVRRNFTEPGDLAWRAETATKLAGARITAPSLSEWLQKRPAPMFLEEVA
ncbi:DEAD/DEAH box helicase [Agrobacterium leguminum]|uniref:DEAD/DEAH box helicase n=1 Tax=Agrobacterium leguminum TaxID=2792015 RepID=UPI0030D26F2A